MRRTVPPSAEIEARIEHMLAVGVGENPRESLSELARLGARLIIQRAVEDEFDAWLGRARYERRPGDQREERGEESGLRNEFRARRVQTAEGELQIEIPQVRQAAETFASKLFPRTPKLLRTAYLLCRDWAQAEDLLQTALVQEAAARVIRPQGPPQGQGGGEQQYEKRGQPFKKFAGDSQSDELDQQQRVFRCEGRHHRFHPQTGIRAGTIRYHGQCHCAEPYVD